LGGEGRDRLTKRNVWLVSTVQRRGSRLILVAYNDTKEVSAALLADPPMLAMDNAGLVRGWLEGRPQPLVSWQSDPNDSYHRLMTENVTEALARMARDN